MAPQMTLVAKNLPANAGEARDMGLISGLGRSPGGECMAVHSSVLAWRIHGHRRLADYSPQGCKESEMTETT